ncbi:hypothetical protein CARUB_v10006031mg [Capsella rubella]|uniref:Uncharacterized protein n=1 Tax=Capsella rubella TaxID=81985 RepID=R0F722_9BRAS|nr:hypothetical protein CARUB_v10006031mg [Capsella rubella]
MGRRKTKDNRENLSDPIKSNPKAEEVLSVSCPEAVAEETDVGDVSTAAEETEKAIASLAEAAAKIVPSDLAAYLAKEEDVPELGLWSFYFYLESAFPQISSQWLNVFYEVPSSDVSNFLLQSL